MTEQQYLEAPPVVPEAPVVTKDRRVLRAVLRWTAAVAAFAVVGTGTAFGISELRRTDVQGLATAPDGRWDYPALTAAPLPAGSPGPFADTNKAGTHYADLRALVLSAPRSATEDKSLRGRDGWLPTDRFLAEYADGAERADLRQKLVDSGLRHVTARGWTTPDGTHTRVFLLQFGTAAVIDALFDKGLAPYGAPTYRLVGTDASDASVSDDGFAPEALVQNVNRTAYVEKKPYGAEQVRQAYLAAGDVLALVVQSRKGAARAVPFQQTVLLQSQLLG